MELLPQSCKNANISIVKKANPYPQEELGWLATTSFNLAVDAFGAKRDQECQRWANLAMSLAHYGDDGGVLERKCLESMAKLNFDMD